jgi:hypothetical protein
LVTTPASINDSGAVVGAFDYATGYTKGFIATPAAAGPVAGGPVSGVPLHPNAMIRAQTNAFDDFVKFKGEAGARDAGRMRQEGKDYLVKDGDVIEFLHSH